MSRSLTFTIPFDIKGTASTTDTYVIPLTPASTSTSYYARHFYAATTVEVVSAVVTVSVIRPASDKGPFTAAACFAAETCSAASVAALARGKPFADGYVQHTSTFSEGVGLRRVLRGVPDAGDLPAIIVKLACGWDASAVAVAAVVSASITLSFEGMSDAAAFDQAIALPAKK